MAWIDGTERRTYDIRAPLAEVYAFFASPEQRRVALADLDRYELLDERTARWFLKEKNDKGLKYRADYTVRYAGNGVDRVEWSPVAGNLRSTGRVVLREKAAGVTEVDFEETLSTDLPIPSLMAKLFQPLVAREIRRGVQGFLDRVKARLEGT